MQSTTNKEKVKYLKLRGFITCSELMIDELARSLTTLINVYFPNNEQVFAVVFCFTHAEHHICKLKLYNN